MHNFVCTLLSRLFIRPLLPSFPCHLATKERGRKGGEWRKRVELFTQTFYIFSKPTRIPGRELILLIQKEVWFGRRITKRQNVTHAIPQFVCYTGATALPFIRYVLLTHCLADCQFQIRNRWQLVFIVTSGKNPRNSRWCGELFVVSISSKFTLFLFVNNHKLTRTMAVRSSVHLNLLILSN